MSLKSNLLRFGGYASLFVPGLNVAAPAIIAGTNAIASGMENSEAAKQANEQLQAGNNQAIDLYKDQFAPYTNLGSQAANTLGGLMGFSPLPSSSTAMVNQQAPAGEQVSSGRKIPPGVEPTGQAVPRGTLASLAVAKPTDSSFRTVRMRSKDGTEEADVPESKVQHFLSLGGQVVS